MRRRLKGCCTVMGCSASLFSRAVTSVIKTLPDKDHLVTAGRNSYCGRNVILIPIFHLKSNVLSGDAWLAFVVTLLQARSRHWQQTDFNGKVKFKFGGKHIRMLRQLMFITALLRRNTRQQEKIHYYCHSFIVLIYYIICRNISKNLLVINSSLMSQHQSQLTDPDAFWKKILSTHMTGKHTM